MQSAELFGISAIDGDIHCTPYRDKQFDSVIFREVVEHLDVSRSLSEACRIARRTVIIFQSHLNPILSGCRWLVGQKEFGEGEATYCSNVLASQGFAQQRIVYSDVIALPISGGLVRSQPRWKRLYEAILYVDRKLTMVVRSLQLERQCCWRYMLTARRQEEAPPTLFVYLRTCKEIGLNCEPQAH